MQNKFTDWLLANGWQYSKTMTFQSIHYDGYEIFFDTSNQVELYFENSRVDYLYLLSENDLVDFLYRNNLLSIKNSSKPD